MLWVDSICFACWLLFRLSLPVPVFSIGVVAALVSCIGQPILPQLTLDTIVGATTGLGTIALSVFAYRQTRKNEEDRKMWQREKDHFEAANTKRPFLIISGVEVGNDSIESDERGLFKRQITEINLTEIHIHIKNCGDGPAVKIRTTEDTAFGIAPERMRHRRCLEPGASLLLTFKPRSSIGVEKKVEMKYENMLGIKYVQTFQLGVSEIAVYDDEAVELEEGGSAHELIDKEYELFITSLSEQKEEDQV